ncbi:MAG: hypothetical protein AAFO69_06205, partial [Bacteroidota bacterium]
PHPPTPPPLTPPHPPHIPYTTLLRSMYNDRIFQIVAYYRAKRWSFSQESLQISFKLLQAMQIPADQHLT